MAPTSATPAETFPDDLEGAIEELKEERNAVLLAHYYQESEVQDLADFVGDSLALAQAAARVDRDVIVFAGVHFMAETAKILNPDKPVIVPDLAAGCSLADGCPPDALPRLHRRSPRREGPLLYQLQRRGEGDERSHLHFVQRRQDGSGIRGRAADLRARSPSRSLGRRPDRSR